MNAENENPRTRDTSEAPAENNENSLSPSKINDETPADAIDVKNKPRQTDAEGSSKSQAEAEKSGSSVNDESPNNTTETQPQSHLTESNNVRDRNQSEEQLLDNASYVEPISNEAKAENNPSSPKFENEKPSGVKAEESLSSIRVKDDESVDSKAESSRSFLENENEASNSTVSVRPLSADDSLAKPPPTGDDEDNGPTVSKTPEVESSDTRPLRLSAQELLTGEKPHEEHYIPTEMGPASIKDESILSLKRYNEEPRNIHPSALNLTGPTASEYNYRERLTNINEMENALKERAVEATINILSQNVPVQQQHLPTAQQHGSFTLSMASTSDDLTAKIKQLDNKIKTVNRRLQESKREKGQLEARIRILELQMLANNNEKLISRMLDQTPTEDDLIALERIKESIRIRADRVKAIREMERRTFVLNKVLESADTFINSLSVVAKYKHEGSTETLPYELLTRSRSHDLAPATFPKPADIITFERAEDEQEPVNESPARELARKKSLSSDLNRDSGAKFQMFKRKSRGSDDSQGPATSSHKTDDSN